MQSASAVLLLGGEAIVPALAQTATTPTDNGAGCAPGASSENCINYQTSTNPNLGNNASGGTLNPSDSNGQNSPNLNNNSTSTNDGNGTSSNNAPVGSAPGG